MVSRLDSFKVQCCLTGFKDVFMVQKKPARRPACPVCVRWTPHPVIVTIRDNRDYMRVLLFSYFTTITGCGVHLRYTL